MSKNVVFPRLLVALFALSIATTACSESGNEGTQDIVPPSDSSVGDVRPNDAVEDTTLADSIAPEDVVENDTSEDGASKDSELQDSSEADASPLDAATQNDTIEEPEIADATPIDGASEEDLVEDIEQDILTPPFNQPIEISDGTDYESGELHQMTVSDAGNISIFWRGSAGDGSLDLLISQSDAMGNAFGEPIPVKEDLKTQMIGVGGDMLQHLTTFYLVWRDESPDGDQLITFRKTTDPDFGGSEFTIDSSAAPVALWRPQLLRNEAGTLCVMWERKQGQVFDVMLRCSLDDGVTWQETVQVDDPNGQSATVSGATFNTAGSLVVAVQVKNKNVQHVMVQVSNDLGVTWTKATSVDGLDVPDGLVSHSLNESGNLKPSLVHTTTGNLKLAWHKPLGGGTAGAYLMSSVDGLSWTKPELMPDGNANVALVIGRGSDLHASSVESILGQGDTLYMSSPDEGMTWSAANPIPKSLGSTLIDHRMAANLVNGWLHIAWWESLPDNLIKQKLVLMTVDGP